MLDGMCFTIRSGRCYISGNRGMDFGTSIKMDARPIDSVQSVSHGWGVYIRSTGLKEISMYSEDE